jgi:zinc D-Ala-D-Ala carboxypeptidase
MRSGYLVPGVLSWSEVLSTDHRDYYDENGNPPQDIIRNLVRHAKELWTPARALIGVPLHVTSGYRCPGLNAIVGGSKTSAHCRGLATDNVPVGRNIFDAFVELADAKELPYDQIIFEFGRWIHLGSSPGSKTPRRQKLMTFGGGIYEPWDPTDPRVSIFRSNGGKHESRTRLARDVAAQSSR